MVLSLIFEDLFKLLNSPVCLYFYQAELLDGQLPSPLCICARTIFLLGQLTELQSHPALTAGL